MRMTFLLLMAALPAALAAATYELGAEMEAETFWKSDPVLFVRKHAESGLEFTSDQRTGAASRLDGGVSYFGVPVYETRIAFGEAGGITRVELMLFAPAGTETYQELADENGRRFRRRVRVEKTVSRAEFGEILQTVRGKLTKKGAKPPKPAAPAHKTYTRKK